jgi:Rrf2 family protein
MQGGPTNAQTHEPEHWRHVQNACTSVTWFVTNEMILPTSSRFAVAVHSLVALCAHGDRPVASEKIAASASTNPAVIRRLFSMLNEAGLTVAQLGQGGGAKLARPATKITLLDVFLAVEEPEIFATHRTEPDYSCIVGRNDITALEPVMDCAAQAMKAELAKVTLAAVADDVARRGGAAFPLVA